MYIMVCQELCLFLPFSFGFGFCRNTLVNKEFGVLNCASGVYLIKIIILMSIYHALINALSAHVIHINLNVNGYLVQLVQPVTAFRSNGC